MRRGELRRLGQTLLRQGMALRFVVRTVSELRDHHQDLRDEAIRRGCSPAEAAASASARLGRPSVIVAEMMRHPELRCRVFHWRWVPALLRRGVLLAWASPALTLAGRGPFVARWCVSTGAAALFTVSFLLLMTQLFTTRIAVF